MLSRYQPLLFVNLAIKQLNLAIIAYFCFLDHLCLMGREGPLGGHVVRADPEFIDHSMERWGNMGLAGAGDLHFSLNLQKQRVVI